VVIVPADAVIHRNDEVFSFVINEKDVAEKRLVTTGIEIDDQVEITSGLEPGERLVVMGQRSIEDGAQVRVVERIAPAQTEPQ